MEIIKAVRLPMTADGEWVVVGQDRWALWHHPKASSIGFARFAPAGGGAWSVAELRFAARTLEAPVRANDLRLLTLGRLETLATDPEIRLMLDSPRSAALPKISPDSTSLTDAVQRCEALELRQRRSSLKLDVPPKGQRGAEWYLMLALAYANASARSRHPAQDLAEANNVPASTVHAWLKALRKYQAERDKIRRVEQDRENAFYASLERLGLDSEEDYREAHGDDFLGYLDDDVTAAEIRRRLAAYLAR